MNLLDLGFTEMALRAGASEGNPVMASLFSHDPVLAASFKISLIASVSLALWLLRRYKIALQATVVATTIFAGILAYHGAIQVALAVV